MITVKELRGTKTFNEERENFKEKMKLLKELEADPNSKHKAYYKAIKNCEIALNRMCSHISEYSTYSDNEKDHIYE